MEKHTFILAAMQTQDDFLSRFLDISQDDVETTEDNKTLMDMVSDTYDQMPEEEILKFQNELAINHDYINFDTVPTIEQRLHRFNQHIDLVSRVVSNDTLRLHGPGSDVEYYGSDEFFRSEYLTVYWTDNDYDEICRIPQNQDDEAIIYRVMELAEAVDYDRDLFEESVKSKLGQRENAQRRAPSKGEVDTILNQLLLLAKTGQNDKVQQLTETFIQKWDLENLQAKLPGEHPRTISQRLKPAIETFPDLEWVE